MDKLTKYRQIIRKILSNFVALDARQPVPGMESFLIADEQSDSYLWMNLGWEGERRTCGATVYVRIRNEKFYIEEDWTEGGIADDLLDAGVPKEDIVLAFHPPNMRQYTEFAAA